MSVEVKGAEEVEVMIDALSKSVSVKASEALRRFGFNLYALLRSRTPIDSGRLVGDWKTDETTSAGAIASFKIVNNMPYAAVVELGSKAGERPWKSVGPLTMMIGDRIYSKQAPGGMIAPILTKVSEDAVKEIFMEINNVAT